MGVKSTRPNDRRSQYTKKAIREAYLDFLEKKDADKITVTEICELAQINRCTFYLHYDDARKVLEELENKAYERLLEHIHRSMADEKNRQLLSDHLYEAFRQDREFCMIAFGQGHTSNLLNKLADYAKELSTELFVEAGHMNEREACLLAAFIIGGCSAAIRDWYENGFKDTEKENVFVNKLMAAIYDVTVDPYVMNEVFKRKFRDQTNMYPMSRTI